MPNRKQSSSRAEGPKSLKIGEVASLLNTTTRTLRFYEEQGILNPAKTTKGVRLYTNDDTDLVHATQQLTTLGVALRDIAELATIRSRSKTGDESSHKVFALLEELRQDVERKKQECELVLKQIDSTARLVKRCFGCKNPPTYHGCEKCPVIRNVDRTRLLRLIWNRDKPEMVS